jgi:hypothetical protein
MKSKKSVSLTKKHKSSKGGLTKAGRDKYNKETGSNLKAPVTADAAKKSPSKAKRRKSFCSRMSGLKSKMASESTKKDQNSRVNKALRRWDCS